MQRPLLRHWKHYIRTTTSMLICLRSSVRRVSCRTQTTLFTIYSTGCRDKGCHCSNWRAAPDTGSAGMTTPRRATGVLTATDGAERLLSSKVYEWSTTDENVLSGMQFYLYFTVCEWRVIGTYDKAIDYTIYSLSIFYRVTVMVQVRFNVQIKYSNFVTLKNFAVKSWLICELSCKPTHYLHQNIKYSNSIILKLQN